MRIAVWHNLPSGGAKRALFDHLTGLLGRGHTVEIWCPSSADQTYLPLSPLATEHVLPLTIGKPAVPNTPLTRALHQVGGTRKKMAALDAHCRAAADQINRGGFDLSFVNTCRFTATPPIGRYLKIPSVAYIQEPFRALYEAMPLLPWAYPAKGGGPRGVWRRYSDAIETRAKRIQVREESANARSYRKLLVNSYFSQESMRRSYGITAEVCYLGVDAQRFSFLETPREKMVIGLGEISPHKNVAFSIDAIAEVDAAIRPRLLWVGNKVVESYLAEMKALATRRGVQFETKLRVTDAQLTGLLNTAAAMLYAPILEPFGFAALEANLCGCPVIGVKEGGPRETIIDGVNGFSVDRDPKAFARRLEMLLRDSALHDRLSRGGREYVMKTFSPEKAIDELEHYMSEVVPNWRSGAAAVVAGGEVAWVRR